MHAQTTVVVHFGPFETGSTEKMVAYGLIYGALAFVGGGLLGAALSAEHDEHDLLFEKLEPAFIGGTIAESLLLPVGVHVANGERGQLALSMPASFALGVGGGLMARKLERSGRSNWAVLVTPIAQLAAAIAIERATEN
jgi:hypothetical protein